jgi:hypothetical protein
LYSLFVTWILPQPFIIPLSVSNEEMYPHFYMDFFTKKKEAEPIVL